jgi:hypothetical protein
MQAKYCALLAEAKHALLVFHSSMVLLATSASPQHVVGRLGWYLLPSELLKLTSSDVAITHWGSSEL